MVKSHFRTLVSVVALFAVVGCGTAELALESAVDRGARQAGAEVGQAVGERVGQMAASMILAQFPDDWNQRWMTLYVRYLFALTFHSGSYAVVQDAYEVGEWTRWRLVHDDEPAPTIVERAFLERRADGSQWWRVRYRNMESDESIAVEALFSEDRGELLRLVADFPDEQGPQELPVEEGSYGYAEATRLTDESLAGATVGTESVQVPAGEFTARHVRYGAAGATFEWWLTEDVPGGMVKYLRGAPGEQAAEGEEAEGPPSAWTVVLEEYGTGAQAELVTG